MKLTDEAYERATDAISTLVESWPASASPPFHPDLGVRGTMRALAIYALEAAALPHLTDDGAAAPPADSTGVGAPAAAESATTTAAPSSPHRPTCGTTYGESCDGYCPTPAIDREALYDVIATVRDASPRRWDDADTWDTVAAIQALMRGEAQ